MDLAQCGLRRSEGQLQQYKDLGCGKDVVLENCSYYKYKLAQNPKSTTWQNKFDNEKCKDVLNAHKENVLNQIYNEYTDIDRQRIEKESKYQRNKMLFIGGMVILSVLGIILSRQKKP